uniref:cysteine synthase n=1 Tax=Oryza barthii TaxID=65489 RepID=A0A0D3GHX7_9ORYZ
MEAELLTTLQEVAIVDEVTVIKDKRPLLAWIRTPRFGFVTSRLLRCLVLCLILRRETLSLHLALTELVRPALAKKATEEDITEFHRINAAFCSSWVEMGEEIKHGEEGPDMAAPEEEEQGRKGIPSLLSSSEENIASNITQLIGWTPLVEMKNIAKNEGVQARLVGKMEAYQPLCSVKDRSALRMIEDAEEKGLIIPGVTTLIEPTSGNLGIGLVLVAVQKGYRFIAVMPAKYSLDKQMLLRFLGAELILTDPAIGFNGPEIWKDTAGKVDVFVASVGSGGTLTGVGRYLKMKNPSINIVCVEPSESPVISGGSPGPHKIQGTGAGFIPEILDKSVIDEVVTVSTEESMAMARRLAKEEGLLVGISSGANVAACIKIAAREENKGKMIVTMFPSGGERYMNSDLFAPVREECDNMTF